MVFSNSRDFDADEINLAQNFLEKLIGKNEQYCRKKAEEKDFLYLDHWNKKMGFVKEGQDKYLILSLQFEENKCHFYQLIIKESDSKWMEGKVLDYNLMRELGIIDKSSKGSS